jgi:hypothetical protein
VNRPLKEERGAIMVLSAILVPLLLVLVALVYDGGTWFTHKRQLQNRADAGALAAGVEYSRVWASCAGTAAEKLDAADSVDAAARDYAGDPAPHAYPNLPPGAGTLHNTEITEQTRLNVEINSNAAGGHVDPDTSWNDPAGSGLGPCDAQTTTDRFSPIAATHYVDVGVRERDQRSLFGMFGVDLFRNEAHARVELKTVTAGKGFLPIALPDQVIAQAEIRYYRECGSGAPALVGQADLQPLANAYQTVPGSTLWGPTLNNVSGGTPTGIPLDFPESSACSGDYIPISAEVRVAGVPSSVIDISTKSCAYLQTATFTDCWSRVSNIRDFKDNPSTQPWFQEVSVNGGTTGNLCQPDVLYARPASQTDCDYSASVSVDWNGLATGRAGKNFKISIGGAQLGPPNGANGSPNGNWSGGGLANNNNIGRSDLMLTWTCNDGPNGNGPSCGSGSVPVQSLFLADDSNGGLLNLVETSIGTPQAPGGQPLSSQWYRAGNGVETRTVYPTVGLDAALYVGQHRVLRVSGPQSNQSIDCEPNTGGQGHDFVMFANGCRPWYTFNNLTGPPWWFPGASPPPGACPDKNGILAQPNDEGQPWQCVIKAPGSSPNVIGDAIATAIGNCNNVQNNSCNQFACNNPNYYDPANPNRWALGTGEPSPRVVFLFVVPYGAYRNTPSQGGLPVLNFVAFYITGWRGNGASGENPCAGSDPDGPGPAVPDEPNLPKGGISGYFVSYTMPSAPGDPHSICVLGQLRPCVPVLVR